MTDRLAPPPSVDSVLTIDLPAWVSEMVDVSCHYVTDHERMGLAIDLARENVMHETGGPFGAAIFEIGTGALVAVGVNSVVRLNNSTLHGEMVAFMMAQSRRGSYTLGAADGPRHEMATSCEPCAMCLGATLWSGVRRLAYGATRDDARALHFDEGPVFVESYTYLEARGIEIAREVRRDDARGVLELYRQRAGRIYNG
ncbi:MAG: nucleoside deaminase [Gemmatimonadaceae bacterium]